MAIDTERERRTAFNFMMYPFMSLPVAEGSIEDEDRAMVMNTYLENSFPPPIPVVAGGRWVRGYTNRI